MSLTETVNFDKEGRVVRFPWLKHIFLSLVIILVAFLSFGIGKLSSEDTKQITIQGEGLDGTGDNSISLNKSSAQDSTGGVFASSKGTKYYYPRCSNTISLTNKITFPTPKDAESAGYTLASNCKPK